MENFIVKIEGGQHDGFVFQTDYTSADQLPPGFCFVDEDMNVTAAYDLDESRISKLPPIKGVARGAVYVARTD